MYSISLDKNNYLTGDYYKDISGVSGTVEVSNLPNCEDPFKIICYKYENNSYIFDEVKYNTYLDEQSHAVPDKTMEEKLTDLTTENTNLNSTLTDLMNTVVMMSMM